MLRNPYCLHRLAWLFLLKMGIGDVKGGKAVEEEGRDRAYLNSQSSRDKTSNWSDWRCEFEFEFEVESRWRLIE